MIQTAQLADVFQKARQEIRLTKRKAVPPCGVPVEGDTIKKKLKLERLERLKRFVDSDLAGIKFVDLESKPKKKKK